ncbi:MAG: gamma-glutamyl-gamma-aminobutyrate hydrolase family protein [Rhodospirillaceae bacterium]
MTNRMSPNPDRLLIGISPRILRDPPGRLGFAGKTLQYLEQSVAHWVMSLGQLVVMIPTVERGGLIGRSQIDVSDYARALDGLILQGGADIDPGHYGEASLPLLGPVDAIRDAFELELVREFVATGKPVFGICRGLQLINVAYGGTLFQDLLHQGAAEFPHTSEAYDGHTHGLTFTPNSWLSALYPSALHPRVNSIHHQGIKTLGRNLTVEATSEDGVIEAVRGTGPSFIFGVQWHPEFHTAGNLAACPGLLASNPLMEAFLSAALARRET